MATANPGPGPEHLHCLLCTREYDVPRTLPCHHTYCEKCLSSYIESVGLEETDSGTKFDCPACKCFIKVSDSSLSVGELASSFPLNTLYVSFFSSYDNKECDACRRNSETQDAVVWCNDCGEALCTECYTTHRKLRLTCKHKVVNIDDSQQRIPYLGELHGDCPKHPGKAVETFCLVHREPCCSVCVPTLHSGCKPIRSVEDIGKRFAKYPTKFSCLPELEDMRTRVKIISDQEESHIVRLDQEYTDMMSSMEKIISKAKSNLDLVHQHFKETNKEKWDSKKQKLKDFQSDSRMMQTDIENCVKIISAMTALSPPQDQFLIQEKLKAQIKSHSQEMNSKMKAYRETRLKLELESAVDKIAHSLNSIGYIIDTESPSINVQTALSRMEENIVILKQKPEAILMEDSVSTTAMLGSLVTTHAVDLMVAVAEKEKSEAQFGSRTFLLGGEYIEAKNQLVLADCGNNAVVVFYTDGQVVMNTKLTECLYDVAYSDKYSTVLVRTGTGILKYSVTGTGLQYTGTVHLPMTSSYVHVCGIAVPEDTIVVGTDDSVQLLTMDGTVQKTIHTRGHVYVAVCGDLKRFCYPDNDVIVCCDMDGRELFRYSDKSLISVIGLAFDKCGHIYVCCCTSSNGHVYQISPDGQRGRVLRLDQSNISRPYGIMCHPTKDEIAVTSYMESVAFETFILK